MPPPDTGPPSAYDLRQEMEEFGREPLRRPSTDHKFIYPSVDSVIDIQPDPDTPGRFNIELTEPPVPMVEYVHTIQIDGEKLPDDWYDGKPKVCHGSGQATRAIRTGEDQDQDHGQGYEHVYLSRCLFCNVPFSPSEPMPEHTFIPVRPNQEYTFRTGAVLEGIEPPKCDGDHPIPRCEDPQCWHRDPRAGGVRAPHIVVLCGSMRFFQEMRKMQLDEGLRGNIVLMPCGFSELARAAAAGTTECTPEQKLALDELHKRKIDLADEVIVLNVDGYVGLSTHSEIIYAEENGKPIRWLEPPQDLCGCCHYPLRDQPRVQVEIEETGDVETWHQVCAAAHAQPQSEER